MFDDSVMNKKGASIKKNYQEKIYIRLVGQNVC